MILYSYRCENPECGEDFDAFNRVSQRETAPCPNCAAFGKKRITAPNIDYLGMGVSLSNPTAADKWAKMQREKNSGRMKDSNNDRYGGKLLE